MDYKPGDDLLALASSAQMDTVRTRDPKQWAGLMAVICLAANAFEGAQNIEDLALGLMENEYDLEELAEKKLQACRRETSL